jgi:hypothetical protein
VGEKIEKVVKRSNSFSFSSKLEKADILEKTVVYVGELESSKELSSRERAFHFQQGYLQACNELVELISSQQCHATMAQSSSPGDLKLKLRHAIDRHLKIKFPNASANAPFVAGFPPFGRIQSPFVNKAPPPPVPFLPFMMNLAAATQHPAPATSSASSLFPPAV